MSDDGQDLTAGSASFQGGVSAQAAPSSEGEPSELQAPSGAPTEDVHFGYQGGPIIPSPQVYASFWGASWPEGVHPGERTNLIQFLKDFLASDYMNILSQYGVGNGAGDCGRWMGDCDRTTAQGEMSDADIHTEIQALIDERALPEPSTPSNMALMIFLDDSIEIKDEQLGIVMCEPTGDNAFGYHNSFTTTAGNKFYYSVIPALDDGCLKESCPHDAGCSLQLAASQEQRRTQVASHEFSEMVTDPELNAWLDAENGKENGDICNGRNATITIEGRTWTVQQMYSHADDENGAAACIVGAPQPIPSLLRAG
jgi:hypothetical protein